MDRRGFLKGTLAGVTSAGGIIIAASLPDTEEFVAQVKVNDPVNTAYAPPQLGHADCGEVVFNSKGQPIGAIKTLNVWREPMETTKATDMYRSHVQGPVSHIEYVVVSYGPVMLRVNDHG